MSNKENFEYMNKKVYMLDNTSIKMSELLSRIYSGEVIHSIFVKNDTIYCDVVTHDNLEYLVLNPMIKISCNNENTSGYPMIYHQYVSKKSKHRGRWKFIHRIVDLYNIRTGEYISSDPTANLVVHRDGCRLNNHPSNLMRVSRQEYYKTYEDVAKSIADDINDSHGIPKAYNKSARKLRRIKIHKNLELSRLLSVASKMINDGLEITEDTYNANKYKYSKRPAKWERLIKEFKDESGIQVAASTIKDKWEQMKDNSKVTVYAAGPFFNAEQVATIRSLESFLEDREYKVFSPSRDGVKLVPNSSPEDRMRVFEDNVTHCNGSDLVIAVIDDRDSGTMVELGMRYSHWRAMKDLGIEPYASQECPRIITFSNQGYDVNLMILGLTLCHCKGFEELDNYLKYVELVGLENAKQSSSVHKLGFI